MANLQKTFEGTNLPALVNKIMKVRHNTGGGVGVIIRILVCRLLIRPTSHCSSWVPPVCGSHRRKFICVKLKVHLSTYLTTPWLRLLPLWKSAELLFHPLIDLHVFSHSLTLSHSSSVVHLLTLSLIHPFTLSLTPSLTLSLTHSLIHSFPLTVSLTISLTFSRSLTYSPIHLLIHSLSYSFTFSVSHPLSHSLFIPHPSALALSLTMSLTLSLTISFNLSLSHSLSHSHSLLLAHYLIHSLTISLTRPFNLLQAHSSFVTYSLT